MEQNTQLKHELPLIPHATKTKNPLFSIAHKSSLDIERTAEEVPLTKDHLETLKEFIGHPCTVTYDNHVAGSATSRQHSEIVGILFKLTFEITDQTEKVVLTLKNPRHTHHSKMLFKSANNYLYSLQLDQVMSVPFCVGRAKTLRLGASQGSFVMSQSRSNACIEASFKRIEL